MTKSIKLRAVMEGDDMVVAVEGGFIKRAVPQDGVVVVTDLEELFLPEEKLVEALQALVAARTGDNPSARPRRAAQMELQAPAQTRKTDKKQGSGA